jgi:hypothetical protein
MRHVRCRPPDTRLEMVGMQLVVGPNRAAAIKIGDFPADRRCNRAPPRARLLGLPASE